MLSVVMVKVIMLSVVMLSFASYIKVITFYPDVINRHSQLVGRRSRVQNFGHRLNELAPDSSDSNSRQFF
jgi:hypothetical protein